MNDDELNTDIENENENEIDFESDNESDIDIELLNELAENFQFSDLQSIESENESNNLLLTSENFNFNLVFLGLLLILLVNSLVKEY